MEIKLNGPPKMVHRSTHVDDVPYIKDHPNEGLLWKAWIESLPSAQPEIDKDFGECEDDLISRQAAIEALQGRK